MYIRYIMLAFHFVQGHGVPGLNRAFSTLLPPSCHQVWMLKFTWQESYWKTCHIKKKKGVCKFQCNLNLSLPFFGTFLWTSGEVLLSLGVHFIMQAFAFWPRARSNLPVTLIGQATNMYHANLFNIDEISSEPYCCWNATACGQSRRLSFILSAPQIRQIFHIFQTHWYSPLSTLVHRRFSNISTL